MMAETSGPSSLSADLSGCAALPQVTGNEMAFLFLSAVTRAGGEAVDVVSHAFPGVGLTCAVILRQSHAVLHTWPGSGTINLDIYSSAGNLACMQIITDLGAALGATQMVIHEHQRSGPGAPAVQAV
jgi:S-adenosylmethionine/arginine decarboxylase-like enzyme